MRRNIVEEKVNCFIASVSAVNRSLANWERQKNMTGQLPEEEAIQKEWKYFSDLLEVAQEQQIDRDEIVCQHARNCVAAFLRIAPKQALTTN